MSIEHVKQLIWALYGGPPSTAPMKLGEVQTSPSLPSGVAHLDTLTGIEFEKLVTRLLERMGFQAKLTKASGDGGIDIVATLDHAFTGGRFLIQCKRYAPDSTVGAATVREFYGALTADRSAVKGILITTSGFTAQAQEFAKGLPIELIGRDQLERMLQQHGLTVNSSAGHPVDGEASQPKDRGVELLELAKKMSGQNKNSEAIKLLREATQLRPGDQDAWFWLGTYYYQAGLFEESVEALCKARQLKPEYVTGNHMLGLAYLSIKQFDKAVEIYKEVTRLRPNDATAWKELGEAYRGKGARDEALAALNEAIRLNPQADSPWKEVGWLHLATNHYNDAIAAFREAVRLEPDKAINWYCLGAAYYHQGDLEKKLEVLQRLEQLDPIKAREFVRAFPRRT